MTRASKKLNSHLDDVADGQTMGAATLIATCSYQRGIRCNSSSNCCCCCDVSDRSSEHSRRTRVESDEDDGVLRDSDSNVENHRNGSSNSNKTSAWTAYLHLVKGTVGPGCLSLPWAVSQLGIWNGCVAILIVATWTSYNCWTVVQLAQKYRQLQQLHALQHQEQQLLDAQPNDALESAIAARVHDDEFNSERNDADFAMNELAMATTDPHGRLPPLHETTTMTPCAATPVVTYPMIAKWLYGRRFEQYTLLCMCVQQLAICTVFLSFVTTNLQAILLESSLFTESTSTFASTSTDLWNNETVNPFGNMTSTETTLATSTSSLQHEYTLLLTIVALLCGSLLCALPNLSALAPLTSIGTGLLLTGLCLLGAVVSMVLWQNDSDDNSHDSHEQQQHATTTSWSTVPLALCALLYSFEGICLVLPVQASMRHPHTQFGVAFGSAMATACAIFMLVAATCVAAFGRITEGSITAFLLVQYGSSSSSSGTEHETSSMQDSIQLLIRLANAAVSLSVLVTYPLQLFPCLELWSSSSSVATAPSSHHVGNHSATLPTNDNDAIPPIRPSHRRTASHAASNQQHELELLSLMRLQQQAAEAAAVSSSSRSRLNDEVLAYHDSMESNLLHRGTRGSSGRHRQAAQVHNGMVYQQVDSTENSTRRSHQQQYRIPGQVAATTTTAAVMSHTTTDKDDSVLSSSLSTKVTLVVITYVAALAIPHVETLIAVAGAVAGSSTALLIPPALQLAYMRRFKNSSYNIDSDDGDDGIHNGRHAPLSSTRSSSSNNNPAELLSYILLGGGLLFLFIGSAASIRDIIRLYKS